MQTIEFITWYGPYSAGDHAVFPDDVAHQLIAAKKAKTLAPPSGGDPPKRASLSERTIQKA